MSDRMLEREIEQALAVDPSPEYLVQLRMRVAAEAGFTRWTLRRRLALATVGAIVLTVAVALWRSETQRLERVSPPTPLTARPLNAALTGSVAARAFAEATTFVRTAPVAWTKPRRSPPPARVLIAKDEAEALRRLMRYWQRAEGRPLVPANADAGIADIQPPPLIALLPVPELPPINVQPLDSAASE